MQDSRRKKWNYSKSGIYVKKFNNKKNRSFLTDFFLSKIRGALRGVPARKGSDQQSGRVGKDFSLPIFYLFRKTSFQIIKTFTQFFWLVRTKFRIMIFANIFTFFEPAFFIYSCNCRNLSFVNIRKTIKI